MAPIILWMRRDLRLTDNAAMSWTAAQDRPVVPVFVLDEVVSSWGAAPRWRVGLGLGSLADRLAGIGSRLVLRRGDALDALRALVTETGADTVVWNRLYVADERARDEAAEAGLAQDGTEVRTFQGHVLFEPWTVETGTGGFYKVYTPFWKNVRERALDRPLPPVEALAGPDGWPASDDPDDWALGRDMDRGAAVVADHVHVGEEAARDRLVDFIEDRIADYPRARNMLAENGTSGLSENLTYGEISVRECWFAGLRAMEQGDPGAETFLKELVWRDFAHHLAWHTPRLTTSNWKEQWDAFPWEDDNAKAESWRRGQTGLDVVDAAMREIYATGRMHNRSRMLVASYLTKHLMTHWRVGCDWFADCLIDWDPASNALGWQWAAGSGPDAAPFFRIFNPDTQAEKFDPRAAYRERWLGPQSDGAKGFLDAVPRSWDLSQGDRPGEPIVGLKEGRDRALDAYRQRDDGE